MGRNRNDQPASRVVEEPRRSALPYFAVAIVAAITVWSIQQPSISDIGENRRESADQAHEKAADLPNSRHPRGDIRTLFTADDYPADAQRNGEEGTVQAELGVANSGRVSRCTIVRSSSHASLDKATCAILQRRARFTPARDVNGDPVADSVRTPPIVWRLEG